MYNAGDNSMVLNITTNKPTFYIRGLNSGTEYTVEIYAANARGASERTLFETFTLQVRHSSYFPMDIDNSTSTMMAI